MAEERVVTTADGVALVADVHRGPEGAPALLMIPGLGSSRRVYDALLPGLTEFRTVVVYDPRGIGDSGMSEPPWTLGLLGDDARTVVTALAPGGVADVFGASMGGVVAQHLALDHPGSVRRLVLAATTPGGPRTVSRNSVARDRLLGKGATTPAEAYRLACTVLYSRDFQYRHPDFIDAQVAYRGAHPIRGRAFGAQAAASFAHDEWDRLDALRVPVLVLHGTEDAVMPLANARLLAARIPGARHQWFTGLGHLFFHEDPAATVAAMRAFLDAAVQSA